MLEAMACGAPRSYRGSGAPFRGARRSAVLVDPLDAEAIAAGHRRGRGAGDELAGGSERARPRLHLETRRARRRTPRSTAEAAA